MRLSVVVPVYNEAPNLADLVARIAAAVRPLGRAEILLVDDGSTDESASLFPGLCAAHPELRVLQLRRNYGQSAALTAGLQQSRGELVATLDGDLQNDPDDLPALVAELERGGWDLVHGWRRERQDPGFSRKLPSLVANKLIVALTGVRLHDYGCALKVLRGELARELILYGELHRFVAVLAHLEGARILEVPVRHHPRTRGQSKYGWSRLPRVVLDLLLMRFFQQYLTRPFQFFGRAGMLIGAGGAGILAWLGWVKFVLGHDIGQRPLLLLGSFMLLVAFISLGLGLVAELVIRAYFEASGRRIYRIRRTWPPTP